MTTLLKPCPRCKGARLRAPGAAHCLPCGAAKQRARRADPVKRARDREVYDAWVRANPRRAMEIAWGTTHRRAAARVAYLGGKCVSCGYSKCIEALHAHHRAGTIKGDWTRLRTRKLDAAVKVELDKCDLLCANCHAEVHAEMDAKAYAEALAAAPIGPARRRPRRAVAA